MNLPHTKHIFTGALIAALMCTLAAAPAAHAEDISELQQKVEQTAQDYNAATKKYNEVAAQVSENEKRISELQEQLPKQRLQAASAVRSLYKFQQGSPNLVTLILSTDDFHSFISMVTYLGSIQNKNTEALQVLMDMQNELNERSKNLDDQKKAALEELNKSKAALKQASEARKAAQEKADREAAEQAKAAQEAIEAARAAAAKKEESFKGNGENAAPIEIPKQEAAGDKPDLTSDRDQFISKWAPRINKYLAGSPMANTGKTFAAAAWDAGVDPRWSPAIATIESSKGRAIPNRNGHNAWGWTKVGGGFRTFSSWEEAIDAHVHYLARVYGPNITPAAARKYCPPNWQYWYSSVLAQMQRI